MSNNKNLKKETKLQSNKINERKPEKKLGLGKGLGALIPDVDFNVDKKGFNIPITDNRKKLDKNKINIIWRKYVTKKIGIYCFKWYHYFNPFGWHSRCG